MEILNELLGGDLKIHNFNPCSLYFLPAGRVRGLKITLPFLHLYVHPHLSRTQ